MDILLNLPDSRVKICSNYGLSLEIIQTLRGKLNKRFNNAFAKDADFCLLKPGESKKLFYREAGKGLDDYKRCLAKKLCKRFGDPDSFRFIEHENLVQPYYIEIKDSDICKNKRIDRQIHYEARNNILYIIDDELKNLKNLGRISVSAHDYNEFGSSNFGSGNNPESYYRVYISDIIQPVLLSQQGRQNRDFIDTYPYLLAFARQIERAMNERDVSFSKVMEQSKII